MPSVGLPLFVVIATVVSVVCRRRSRTRGSLSKIKGHEATPILINPTPRRTLLELTPDDVTFLTQLGEGAYGKLYVGSFCTESGKHEAPAFVKVITDREDPSSQGMVLQEAFRLAEIVHPNIVRMFGLALGGKVMPTLMLYEYAASVDLRQFLVMCSCSYYGEDLVNRLEINDRIRVTIIRQVANAAGYLASRGLVHRDIAARNVLVGKSMTVRLCDFGLCVSPYEDDYYLTDDGSLVPVRWMSPEALLQGQFSEASDVWAFGVLLWEMYNPGSRPYEGHSDEDVVVLLKKRRTWSFGWAQGCRPPAQIGALVSECWNDQPSRRPRFKDVFEMMCQLDPDGDFEDLFEGHQGQTDGTPAGSNSSTASTDASPTLPYQMFSTQALYRPQQPTAHHSIQCYAPLLGGSHAPVGPSNRFQFNQFSYSSTTTTPVGVSTFPVDENAKCCWYHWSHPPVGPEATNLV